MANVLTVNRKVTKNRVYCAVPGCGSKSHVNLNLVFHYFPKRNQRVVHVPNHFGNKEVIDQHKLWKRKTRVNNVNNYTKICSLHFTKDDYILPEAGGSKRSLKKNAIPSQNLPNIDDMKEKKKQEANNGRLKRRSKRENEKLLEAQASKSKKQKNSEELNEEQSIHSTESDVIETPDINFPKFDVSKPLVKNAEIQVQSGDFLVKFYDFFKNDSDLSTATGLESFKLLETIINIVQISGLKKNDHTIKMHLKDRIILTFVKLKQNLSYSFLGILFGCSSKHCQRIFTDTIVLLSTCLKCFTAWPSKEEILKNMPLCFERFEDVRVVVDCTEIFIQSPKNLCCQISTYSHYKSAQTCKILTGVTPAGNISFVSKVYGGRSSDKVIFEQSGLINCLEPGDAIMVDRGFLIDETCSLHNIKCMRPPFLKGQKQFSKADALETDNIAKARVHVERSNQRIKVFKIVGDTLPVNLVPLLQDIFTVICGVVNLSAPILKDDKFMDI